MHFPYASRDGPCRYVFVGDTPLAGCARAAALCLPPGASAVAPPRTVPGVIHSALTPSMLSCATVHGATTCDGCQAEPLRGTCFHDLDQPNYDLCLGCYVGGAGDAAHAFVAIESSRGRGTRLPPRVSLAAPTSPLLPSGLAYDRAADQVLAYFAPSCTVQVCARMAICVCVCWRARIRTPAVHGAGV